MVSPNERLTSNTGEVDISTLLSNNANFEIPLFQRRYQWQKKQLDQLHSDLLTLIDGTADLHFLGAVIIHGRSSDPGRPRIYELIDGQQRLTTIFLHICAAVKTLVDQGCLDDAEALFTSYLVTRNSPMDSSNLALHPSLEDRAALNEVVSEILANKNFGNSLQGFHFRPLTVGTGSGSRRIVENYKKIKRFYQEQIDPEGIDRIRTIYATLLNRCTVVQINVQDPTNGPKIFDSLNSGQHPMTVGDLVRNDVFAKVASEDPVRAAQLDSQYWQPFYGRFQADGSKNFFDKFFYPYALIQDHTVKQSEAYSRLRNGWKGKSPEQVIADLQSYQNPFLDLVVGTNNSSHPPTTALRFNRLFRLRVPSSTFPFLMRLSRALSEEGVTVDQADGVLDVVDSFLTRRAICGYEPTGLHAVFKGLWADCGGDVTAEQVVKQIAGHRTVTWPRNDEVIKSVKARPIYGSRIAKYLILEYDNGLGGDQVMSDPWIEHVLPTSTSGGWSQFTRTEHTELKDRFANLVPLSPGMNGGLGNKPYAEKRLKYAEDSMYKSARMFAQTYEDWTPECLLQRGEVLASWCVMRWPYQPNDES